MVPKASDAVFLFQRFGKHGLKMASAIFQIAGCQGHALASLASKKKEPRRSGAKSREELLREEQKQK